MQIWLVSSEVSPLEMEIQKTVRDLDIKKKGLSILWEAPEGFPGEGRCKIGTQNSPWKRWRIRWHQNLKKMVAIDFEEIGLGWDIPSLKARLNLKDGGWEVSLLPFWECLFSDVSFREGNEIIYMITIVGKYPRMIPPLRCQLEIFQHLLPLTVFWWDPSFIFNLPGL